MAAHPRRATKRMPVGGYVTDVNDTFVGRANQCTTNTGKIAVVAARVFAPHASRRPCPQTIAWDPVDFGCARPDACLPRRFSVLIACRGDARVAT